MKGGHYSTGESAKILGVSKQKVRSLYNRGELEGFICPGSGRFRRIPAKSLEFYLKKEGYLVNSFYVESMTLTWQEHGFYPSLSEPSTE